MRLTAEELYAADTAVVFAMLTDRAFLERVCVATGALAHEVTVETYDDGAAVVTTRRTMPTDEVPDMVRSFVGPTLQVVQVQDWAFAGDDGSRESTVVVQIEGAPVRLAGTARLTPAGGRTHQALEADLKAGVPVIGGRIEKAVEPALRAALRVEAREAHAWLAR